MGSNRSVSRRMVMVLLLAAVAIAFADASVVALALPDLYGQFDTTVVGVSWVLTIYALAVGVAAVPLAVLHRRLSPRWLTVAGSAIFALSSLVAGAAGSLVVLLVSRATQGVGAALLLAGSLPVLAAIAPGGGRGRRWWALASSVGAAMGPALGGVLTELFSWRAIFFVQAPIVAAALVVAVSPGARSASFAASPVAIRRSGNDVAVANVGFALVFAALVAALFLGVLMAIEVWRYSPAQSAILVSALPLGMIVGRALQPASRAVVAGGGALLLASGLATLAYVPGAAPVVAAAAFLICGAGFDLVHEILDQSAVPPDMAPVQSSAVTVAARHFGLVLGLALIAPVLSSSLDTAVDRATLGATRTMLVTDLPLYDKVPVTWALRDAIEEAPRGQVPELAEVFDERGAGGDNALAQARDDLTGTVTDTVTRSFRPAFALAASLAALSVIPVVLVARRREDAEHWSAQRRTRATVGVGLLGLTAAGVLCLTFAAGRDTGEFVAQDPCTAEPDQYPGDGYDASVQRIALSAINGAACEFGTTRERLVLSLDPNSSYDDVSWDRDSLEIALREGAHRAVDDADDRDAIPGWVARTLGFVIDRAPIGWLIQRVPGFG